MALLRLTYSEGVPLHLLGLGSNVLYPDQGIGGVVARLGGVFSRYSHPAAIECAPGGAVPLPRLARSTATRACSASRRSPAFPSSVGGAVVMNAGCYGVEIKDVLVHGHRAPSRRPPAALSRRRSRGFLSQDRAPGRRSGGGDARPSSSAAATPATALARIDELNRKRWASLPSGLPNAGSIFRNPAGDHAGRLIEAAGLKGRRSGGAQISPKHANVIVNLGGARADDVLALMVLARATVRDAFGVELEPEIVLEGSLRERWRPSAPASRAAPP